MGSFVRVADGICGNDRVGGGDPLENLNLTSGGWWTGICGGWMIELCGVVCARG